MGKKEKDLSIKGQIQRDNGKIVFLIVVIVACSMLNLGLIDWYQNRENYYNRQADDIKEVIIAQYKWVESLREGVDNSGKTELEMDADKCSFGQWYQGLKKLDDSSASADLQKAYEAHRDMHSAGEGILEAASSDQDEARQMLDQELPAYSDEMFTGLEGLAAYYDGLSKKNHDNLVSRIIWAIITNLLFAVAAAVIARKTGNKMARKISEPIAAVADWSEELSKGDSDLDFDVSSGLSTDLTEVSRMIESFRVMAASIQENVRVVQKVADGDMTAFVNIRSASDSLGKNLYRMVQSNDIMFAEITNIANAVAEGAGNIAGASGALAESCSVQASAVKEFSEMIEEVSSFIEINNEKAGEAISVSDEINGEVMESTAKMNELLTAMEAIRTASEQVSAIIRTINEIAAQTNMLALNAAIEAARAGEAGRGFAVVADEVKDLASKSSEAADESKRLIEDTIQKTSFGDTISKETSETFSMISESIKRITQIVREIAEAGGKQQEQITSAKRDILKISDAIDGNAASSQEAAAASDELSGSAVELKEAMNRFNLRKRVPGKPYIPPEKADDPEFIRQAEENYHKAQEEGKAVS